MSPPCNRGILHGNTDDRCGDESQPCNRGILHGARWNFGKSPDQFCADVSWRDNRCRCMQLETNKQTNIQTNKHCVSHHILLLQGIDEKLSSDPIIWTFSSWQGKHEKWNFLPDITHTAITKWYKLQKLRERRFERHLHTRFDSGYWNVFLLLGKMINTAHVDHNAHWKITEKSWKTLPWRSLSAHWKNVDISVKFCGRSMVSQRSRLWGKRVLHVLQHETPSKTLELLGRLSGPWMPAVRDFALVIIFCASSICKSWIGPLLLQISYVYIYLYNT